jgi:hypothetical protein
MSTVYDNWGNPVEITTSYVAYRNRIIDIHLIHTFQTKGRKLLINTYKQNQMIPTMCIFFEDKEKALDAYESMKSIVYSKPSEVKHTQVYDITTAILASLVVPFAVFAALISRVC